jgi:hypothetical protein
MQRGLGDIENPRPYRLHAATQRNTITMKCRIGGGARMASERGSVVGLATNARQVADLQ